jgi:hypothetical protein
MSIVVPSAALSLNCFGPKAKPMKRSPALAAIIALSEYFPVSPPFLRAVKGHLPRLEEPPPVAHALLRVVPAAKCSSLTRDYQEPK